jgi:hypothetical protein
LWFPISRSGSGMTLRRMLPVRFQAQLHALHDRFGGRRGSNKHGSNKTDTIEEIP